jgi:hypothetical protein
VSGIDRKTLIDRQDRAHFGWRSKQAMFDWLLSPAEIATMGATPSNVTFNLVFRFTMSMTTACAANVTTEFAADNRQGACREMKLTPNLRRTLRHSSFHLVRRGFAAFFEVSISPFA